MKSLSLALALALCFSGPMFAQSMPCSTLSSTGSLAAGQTLTLDVTGSLPDALTLLAVGETAGSTTIGGGPLSITLDLDSPFILLPLGLTDMNGDVSLSVMIPANLPPSIMIPALNAQAVTIDFSFSFTPGMPPMLPTFNTCVSNAISL